MYLTIDYIYYLYFMIFQAYELEEERNLPGVIMASEQNTFSLLYKLAQIEVKSSEIFFVLSRFILFVS